MLLSLIPPSYMVIPRRELANTLNLSTSQSHNNQPSHHKYSSINLEIIPSREQSLSPSINSQRDMFVTLSASLMNYPEHIEAQSGKLT